MRAVILAALILSGCATQQELEARDEALCRHYGFAPSTAAFANCVMTQARDRRAAIVNSAPIVCNTFGSTTICN